MNSPILGISSSGQSTESLKERTKSEDQVKKIKLEGSVELPLVLISSDHREQKMEKLKINNVAQTARTMPTFDLMNKNEQMCLEHNKKFCYSCKTCNSEICIDCLTNPAKHRGHRFQRYHQRKDNKKMELTKMYGSLYDKIIMKRDNQSNQIKISEKNKQKVQIEKKKKIQALQKYIKFLKQQYRSEHPIKLEHQHKRNKTEIANLNQFYQNCITKIKTTTKGELILLPHNVLQSKIQTKIDEISQLTFSNSYQQYVNPIRQNLQIFTFVVKEFSQGQSTKSEILFQPFQSSYSLWRLKVYPGGFEGAKILQRYKGIEYMSIYVQRLDGILDKSTFFVQFLITSIREPNLQIKKSFQSQFTKKQSWGYDRFTRITNIYQCGFLSSNDTLNIRVSICPANYYQTNRAIDKIIQDKQRVRQEKNRQIDMLRNMYLKQKQEQDLIKKHEQQFSNDQYMLQNQPQCFSTQKLDKTQPTQCHSKCINNEQNFYPETIQSQFANNEQAQTIEQDKKFQEVSLEHKLSAQFLQRSKYKEKGKNRSHNRSITHI